MRKQKGFTLMELTIVLAIVAILVAILVPSWGYYLQRSRIKSQNAKAKVVFNAAQTIITDLEFYERHQIADYFNADPTDLATTQAHAKNMLYTDVINSYVTDTSNPNYGKKAAGSVVEWYFYWDGLNGYICDVDCNPVSDTARATTIDRWNAKLTGAINKIARSDEVFRVYVKDYTVASVVTARRENDRFLGSHPVTLDQRKGANVDSRSEIKDKRELGIKGVNMTDFELGAI